MKVYFSLFCLFSISLFFGCKNNIDETGFESIDDSIVYSSSQGVVNFENGILKFTTQKSFDEYVEKLYNDNDFFNDMSDKLGKYLLSGYVDNLNDIQQFIVENVPSKHAFLLNKDGAYIIADKYIKFGKGEYYVIPLSEMERIDIDNIDKFRDKIEVGVYSLKPAVLGDYGNARINLNLGAKDGRHQYEFNQVSPVAGKRKYVHEIYAYSQTIPTTGVTRTDLHLVIKLEYEGTRAFGGKEWRIAGNDRTVTYNITWDGNENGNAFSGSASNSFNTTVAPTILFRTFYTSSWSANYVEIEVGGSISQQIVGDIIANKWTNSGSPLW